MGYTHYWRSSEDMTPAQWGDICTYAHRLFDTAGDYGIVLQHEYDEPDTKPDINDYSIQFNGKDEEGHETFYLTREATRFAFCKTARKPYDLIVGKLLWYVAQVVTTFKPSNDDGLNYLTWKAYAEDETD